MDKCTIENPITGHFESWHFDGRFKSPVCGKCGLVVESGIRD